jgi:hypothetical protein
MNEETMLTISRILRRLGKGLMAFFHEVFKPESFAKGEDFEGYVRKHLFTDSGYQLVYKTHDYRDNKKDYVEYSRYPDFFFRDKRTKDEFFVEVKWRKDFNNGKHEIQWCNKSQLRRYKEIDENENPVFIVIGLGINPHRPDKICLFPVSGCNFVSLYKSYIDKYTISVNYPVDSDKLWRIK